MILRMVITYVTGALSAIALCACSVMDTGPTRAYDTIAGARCNSTLGSYALSKTLLRIQVKGTDVDPNNARTALTALQEVSISDPNRVYCLDHLASPTAKDEISVVRGTPAFREETPRTAQTSTSLLTFVSSNTIDYTADIIRKVIRTIFIALSGDANFAPVARSLLPTDNPTIVLADLTFDPFNIVDVVRINEALRPLGFCILLEIGSYDTVTRDGRRFCSDHKYLRQQRARFEEAYATYEQAIDLPARVPGILYRPRQPFRVFIYAKDDPGGLNNWRLVRTAHLKLENISPVLSLGVERAIFSARRTAFLFDRGALVGWCVSKRSELLAAMEIPLEVVRSIVALPSAVLMVRIDEVTKNNELLSAERDLIKVQRQYISFLLDPKATTSPIPSKSKDTTPLPTKAPSLPKDFNFKTDTERQAPEFQDFSEVCTQPKAI